MNGFFKWFKSGAKIKRWIFLMLIGIVLVCYGIAKVLVTDEMGFRGGYFMEIQLGVIEARYADMIWEHEPVTSSELVKMTAVEFNWKRTTAHNVLRRLIDKGLFQNENGLVTAVISREDFYARQSRQYVEDTFAGSLPAFIAAFTQDAKLTPKEAEAIRKMIDQAEEK